MSCTTVQLPDGTAAIVCTRHRTHRPTPSCSVTPCGRSGRYRCDARNQLGHGTCDRWLCEAHRISAGNNVDYCPDHAAAQQLVLDGV